jgi:hypothetical protein
MSGCRNWHELGNCQPLQFFTDGIIIFRWGKMKIFKSLTLRFRPPKINDPDFGQLTFMYIPNRPERSYWEGEWMFPRTSTRVSIALDGDESGPKPEAREWHLELPARFQKILELARPELAKAFKTWLQEELPNDIFTVVKLSGFGVENPEANPVEWDISFETTGAKWLGITIPFVGDKAREAVVDT